MATKKAATVLLLDRRRLHRDLLKQYLKSAAADLVVVDAEELSQLQAPLAHKDSFSLIVLFSLSRDAFHEPLATISHLRQRFPAVPIAVISDYQDRDTIRRTLQQGAKGYISTSIAGIALIHSLRILMAGGEFIPSSALAAAGDADPQIRQLTSAPRQPFTPRETEVLALLREGKPNKVIGNSLSMQESTVKVHVRNIMKKLNAHNRLQVLVATNTHAAEQAALEEAAALNNPMNESVA